MMSDHERCHPNIHTNAFIDLDGLPYVLAEYLDRRDIQYIDRSMIKSSIYVDQSEAMRAIIDVNIDDIGKRGGDGLPAIIGNNTKQRNLIDMINKNANRLDHELNVLRRGIVLRINYQVEDMISHQVIRTMSEDFRILDRNYFLEINPRNVDDNAIIVNFCNSMVSTISEFTHGRNRMIFRITNIQMYYECLKKDPKMPRIKQSLYTSNVPMNTSYMSESDYYQYHEQRQHRHIIEMPGCTCGDNMGNIYEEGGELIPAKWSMFNRFYHFNNGGKDIEFHFQEVNDPHCKSVLIPCGNITTNKYFTINPGHRIIFKFCIWKNDATFTSDATKVCEALKAPFLNDCYHYEQNEHHHHHGHQIDPDYQHILSMLAESRRVNDRQNHTINKLIGMVEDLRELVKNQTIIPPIEDNDGDTDLDDNNSSNDDLPPVIDPPPVDPSEDDETNSSCNCGCSDDRISALEKEIEELKNSYSSGTPLEPGDGNCNCSTTMKPYPSTKIEEIIGRIE